MALPVSTASALIPTTTTVTVAPHPSLSGYWVATPTVRHSGGQITKGECTTYLDGVWLGTNGTCTGEMFAVPAPGTHTVRVDYVPDPYGIPSDRDIYSPSSGSADFSVATAPVTAPPPAPPVTAPVATAATVTTAKKSVAKKKRSFTITVTAADGSAPTGTVFLVIAGPQKVTQKITFSAGRAVTKVVLKKAGRYTATAKVTKTATLDSSKSSVVRFKVVAPSR
ncbi:hypothetical protein [Nocardioides sp. P5_E3]